MSLLSEISNILSLLEKNPILKIVSPIGSGKTYLLPKELSKRYNITMVTSKKEDGTITPKEYWTTKVGNLLIIDEVDQGSFDQFLIITDWTQNKSKDTKLLLLSSFTHSYFPSFPTLRIPFTSRKSIEIRYTRDYPSYDVLLNNLIKIVIEISNSSVEGNFLIFVADKTSVSFVVDKLKAILKDEILTEDSSLSSSLRKILVTTNLGKTSTSFRDFGCIFDTMMEKRVEQTLTGGKRKRIGYISKRDAGIRSSRSSISSIVYRFISKEKYDSLSELPEDVSEQYSPHILLLKFYSKKLNPLEILPEAKYISPILVNYGFLDMNRKFTLKGKKLLKLPLGLKSAIIAFELNTYSGLILACLLDSFEKSPFLFPKKKRELFEYEIETQKHISKYFNRFRGTSDIETFLLMFLDFYLSKEDLKKWCLDNFIDYNYMFDVVFTISKCNKVFSFPEEVNFEGLLEDTVISELYPKLTLDENSNSYINSKGKSFQIDSLSVNTIEADKPKELYLLIGSKINEDEIVSVSFVSPDVSHVVSKDNPITF